MSKFDKELDTSGLNCPLPIIKAKKEINTMEIGEVLHIISTDPGAVKDFESFANQTGNELLNTEEKCLKILIKSFSNYLNTENELSIELSFFKLFWFDIIN